MTAVFEWGIVFFFGACLGSFLNVCIWRLPRAESVIFPGSHCPYCNNKIHWYDNIPLVSYILLKARCRHCNAGIPFRYFLVESAGAAMILFLFRRYGLSPYFLIYTLFFSLLLIATFVDIKHRIIPDEVSIGGVILGLILSFIFPRMQGEASHFNGLLFSLIGALAGALITYITGAFGRFIFKKEAMGFGDVKLMGAVGAFLGWILTLAAFFIAPFFGLVISIVINTRKLKDAKLEGSFLNKLKIMSEALLTGTIPYGPFLSLGAITALLYGKRILGFIFWSY